jgi:hypothetical protein
MGLFDFMKNVAEKSRYSTMLFLIFQDNERMARIAMLNFERCMLDRGLRVTDLVVAQARHAVGRKPKITMGEFIDQYLSRPQSAPTPREEPDDEAKPRYSKEQLQSMYKSVSRTVQNAESEEERNKGLELLEALVECGCEDAARFLRESYTFGINGVDLDHVLALEWAKKVHLLTAGLGGSGVDFVRSDEYESVTCLDDIYDVAMQVGEHKGYFFAQHVFLKFWNSDNPLWRERGLEIAIESAAAHVHMIPDLAGLYYSLETEENEFFACALWTAAVKMGGRLQSFPEIVVSNNEKSMDPKTRPYFESIVSDLARDGNLAAAIERHAPKLPHGAAYAILKAQSFRQSTVNSEWIPRSQREFEIDQFANWLSEDLQYSGVIPEEETEREQALQKAVLLDYVRARFLVEGTYPLKRSQGWKEMYDLIGSASHEVEVSVMRTAFDKGIIDQVELDEYLVIRERVSKLRQACQ